MDLHRHQRARFVVAAAILGAVAPAGRAEGQDRDVSGAHGTTVTIVEPSKFDWGDAGVGAAGAFGLVLLAGGVAIVLRPNRGARDADVEPSEPR
jgi:hypothetical protein